MCLSTGRRDTLSKLLGGHFSDVVVQKVKKGSVFRGTGDNWDLKILKNDDLHLFASNLIENRINFNHLPNDRPRGNIKDFPGHNFSLNVPEWKRYAECAKIILGQIVLELFPKFKFFKAVCAWMYT